MKKILLALCVCAGLCACSSDDDLVSSTSSSDLGQATAYLKVKIKDVNSSTRATSPTDNPFAYGTTAEQAVSNAYFYFYDANGAYMAKGNVGTTSGTAAGAEGTATSESIEWESETVVAVWGLTEGNLPTQMLTVINQPSGVDLTNQDLSTALATLAGDPYADANGNFVMSTVVYEDGGTTSVVNTTALTVNNFAPEPVNLTGDYTDGDYTAVDVYVERLAAKVGLDVDSSILWDNANQGNRLNIAVTDGMFEEWAKAPATVQGSTYVINLQGWDVDCIARDAYVTKKIEAWTGSEEFTGWNDATNGRCYWAESPAYGDATVTYPTSSNGNTAADEDDSSKWLNKYLRYVDLQEPVALGSTTYCGENTNTAGTDGVIKDKSSTALTNVLLKAQFGLEDDNLGTFEGIDIVKYHGEYLTLDDFENDMIAEVEKYDFSSMIDEVAAAIESEAGTTLGNLLHTFVDAIEPVIYCKEKTTGTTYEQFDNRFMQLYSQNDGKVSIWFDTATSVDTGNNAHSNHSDRYGYTIPDYYTATTLVKKADESMDNYDFYFKLNSSIEEDMGSVILAILERLGFVTVGDETVEGSTETGYFLPLGDEITITVNEDENHVYDARNYLIRVIEREAAGINDDWSTAGYPYFYNGGLMYYNVPIEHLATTTGDTLVEAEYGVVRNHWYDITVTSISDFGHAIADEQEVIVPQVEENYYYAAATINILSWKMVNQEVAW